jgi:hypothetical protein
MPPPTRSSLGTAAGAAGVVARPGSDPLPPESAPQPLAPTNPQATNEHEASTQELPSRDPRISPPPFPHEGNHRLPSSPRTTPAPDPLDTLRGMVDERAPSVIQSISRQVSATSRCCHDSATQTLAKTTTRASARRLAEVPGATDPSRLDRPARRSFATRSEVRGEPARSHTGGAHDGVSGDALIADLHEVGAELADGRARAHLDTELFQRGARERGDVRPPQTPAANGAQGVTLRGNSSLK